MRGCAFFEPYFVNKVIHALYQALTSGLKQLRGQAITTSSVFNFEMLNCEFDLVNSRWRNIHAVMANWVRCNFSSGKTIIIIAMQNHREISLSYPQYSLRIRNQVYIFVIAGRCFRIGVHISIHYNCCGIFTPY